MLILNTGKVSNNEQVFCCRSLGSAWCQWESSLQAYKSHPLLLQGAANQQSFGLKGQSRAEIRIKEYFEVSKLL